MIRVINQTASAIPAATLRHAALITLRGRRQERRNLTIAVLTERAMAHLNGHFLKHRGATDVLAFPSHEKGTLGEVAVCPAVARREAKTRGIPWEQELARYVVHGCLHLLGYDDHTPADRKRMWARQEGILDRLHD